MLKKGILKETGKARVVDSFVDESVDIAKFADCPKLALDQMQTEFLQTIGEGWAYPLNRFMNEMELLECLQMKTLTVNGEKHLMSVPITQPVSQEFKEANEKADNIVLTW